MNVLFCIIAVLKFSSTQAQDETKQITVIDQIDYKYSFPEQWRSTEDNTLYEMNKGSSILWGQGQCGFAQQNSEASVTSKSFFQSFEDGLLFHQSSNPTNLNSQITTKLNISQMISNHSQIGIEIGLIINITNKANFDIFLSSDLQQNIIWQSNSLNTGDYYKDLQCSLVTYKKSQNYLIVDSKTKYDKLVGIIISTTISHSCSELDLFLNISVNNKNDINFDSYSGIQFYIGYLKTVITFQPQVSYSQKSEINYFHINQSLSYFRNIIHKNISGLTAPIYTAFWDFYNNSIIKNNFGVFPYAFCPPGCQGCQPLQLNKKQNTDQNLIYKSIFQQSCCLCQNGYKCDEFNRAYFTIVGYNFQGSLQPLCNNSLTIFDQIIMTEDISSTQNIYNDTSFFDFTLSNDYYQMKIGLIDNFTYAFTYNISCGCQDSSYDFDIKNLINNGFYFIFQNDNIGVNSTTIFLMNQFLIKKITFTLKFPEGDCIFNQQFVRIVSVMQNYLPNLEKMELFITSQSQDTSKRSNLIIQENIAVEGFTLLQFTNVTIDLSNSIQDSVNVLFYANSYNSVFNLINVVISGSGKSQQGAKRLSFVLFEFQGLINFINVHLTRFNTTYTQQILGYSYSSLFFDELLQSRSISTLVLNIINFKISNCSFQETSELITFPINNLFLNVTQFFIEDTDFFINSKVFKNSESLQLLQQPGLGRVITFTQIQVDRSNFNDSSSLIMINEFCATLFTKEIIVHLSNLSLKQVVVGQQSILLASLCQELSWTYQNISIISSKFYHVGTVIMDITNQIDYSVMVNLRKKGVIFLNSLFIQNMQIQLCEFNDDSTLLYVAQKDVYIKDLNYTVTTWDQIKGNTFSSLMHIEGFMKIVQLKNIIFNGVHQNTVILQINDLNTEPQYKSLDCQRSEAFYQQSSIFLDCSDSKCADLLKKRCPLIQIINSTFNNSFLFSPSQTLSSPISIYSIREILNIDINKTQFVNNTQSAQFYRISFNSGLLLDVANGNIIILDCKFQQNVAQYSQNSLTIISSSQTVIRNSQFIENNMKQSQTSVKGLGAHAYINTVFLCINNSIFQQGYADQGGALNIIIYVLEAKINVQILNCTFQQNYAYSRLGSASGGHIFIQFQVDQDAQEKDTLVDIMVHNTVFSEGIADVGGAIIIIPNVYTNISVEIINSTFSLCYGQQSHFLDFSYTQLQSPPTVFWNVTINGSTFDQINLQRYEKLTSSFYGDQLYFPQNSTIMLNTINNTFILILITKEPTSYISLQNVKFVHLFHSSFLVTDQINYVSMDTVQVSYGSNNSKFFVLESSCLVSITNSIFHSLDITNAIPNYMFFIDDTDNLIIENNTFYNITCSNCGNGTFLMKNIGFTRITNNLFENNQAQYGGCLQFQFVDPFVFKVDDHQNFLQYIQDFSKYTLIISQNEFYNNKANEGGAIYIIQHLNISMNISHNHQQNNQAQVGDYIRIIGYKVILNNKSLNQEYQNNQLEGSSKEVQVGCLAGYQYSSMNLMCVQCFDSYNLFNNSYQCISCNANQAGNCSKNTIYVKSGYWRINNISDLLTPCNFERNCVGGSSNNICLDGHAGALCDSCDSTAQIWQVRYTRSSANNCVACSRFAAIFLRFFIVLTFIMCLIHFAVYSTLQDIFREITVKYLHLMGIFVGASYQKYLYTSVYLKILITHFMIINIAFYLDIPIPQIISAGIQGFGYPLQQLLYSNDCYTLDIIDEPIIYMRMIFSVVYPILFFCLYAISKMIQQKCIKFTKQRIERGTFLVASIFIILFIQPNLVDTSMGLMTCKLVQGVRYINDDTTQLCFTNLHNNYVYFLCIPVLFIFVGIIPVTVFFKLFRNRKFLKTIRHKVNLGYFLIGYSEGNTLSVYWELVQMFKKMAAIFLLNYFSNKVRNTILSMLIVILIYITIMRTLRPYKLSKYLFKFQERLHYTDSRISTMQFFIFTVTLVLENNKNQNVAKYFLAIILIALNAYCIIYISKSLVQGLPYELLEYWRQFLIKISTNYCQIIKKCLDMKREIHRQRVQNLWRIAYKKVLKHGDIVVTKDVRKSVVFSKMFGQQEQRRMSRSLAQFIQNTSQSKKILHQSSRPVIKRFTSIFDQKTPLSIQLFQYTKSQIINKKYEQNLAQKKYGQKQ